MFRLLHCADLHLDSPFLGMAQLDSEMSEQLRESTFQSFRKIVDYAINQKVDLVTVAGDVYDSADHGLHSVVRFRDQLKRLSEAKIPCCIVAGNHDPLKSRRQGASLPQGCHLFGDKPERWEIDREASSKVIVYGVSFPVSAVKKNLALQLADCYRAGPGLHLALLHCNLGSHSGHDNYAPCSLDELRATPFNAWLLGHVHEHKLISKADPLIVYPGNIQGRHIRESGQRGASLITFHDQGDPEHEFIPTAEVIWSTGETSIENIDTMEELVERIDDQFENLLDKKPDARTLVVRWRLINRGPLHHELSRSGVEELIEIIRKKWRDHATPVLVEKLSDDTMPAIDLDELRQQNSFSSMVLVAARDFETDPGEQERLLNDLARLRNHKGLRKYLVNFESRMENDPQFLNKILERSALHAINAMIE